MIAVLSPAKTLDYDPQTRTSKCSEPEFLSDSSELIADLRKLSPTDLTKLMGISEKLAELNHERYQSWELPFTESNAKQALLAFKGDVYTGFDLDGFGAADFTFAQKHLRILSGLYGVLRPLDLMQPYRLEMGTKFANARGKDLYAFWKEKVTESLRRDLAETKSSCLVNLASVEYFSAVHGGGLGVPVVTPVFRDEKNGSYKIISFYAKKARGMMADYMIKSKARKPVDLQGFTAAGYRFDKASSSDSEIVFLREEKAAKAVA